MRYQSDEWGIGLSCVFTYAGLAVRRGGAWRLWWFVTDYDYVTDCD